MFPQRTSGYPPQSPYQTMGHPHQQRNASMITPSQQPNPYIGIRHQQSNPNMGYPQMRPRNGLFRRATHGIGQRVHQGYQGNPSYGVSSPYYQQPQVQSYVPQQPIAVQPYQQTGLQSLIRDEHGKLDFKKISGGVQTAMGIANQVGPVVKMIGGFLK